MDRREVVLSFEGAFSKQTTFYEMVHNTFLTIKSYNNGCATVLFQNGDSVEKVAEILTGFFNKKSNVNFMISECMCEGKKAKVETIRFYFNNICGQIGATTSKDEIVKYVTSGVMASWERQANKSICIFADVFILVKNTNKLNNIAILFHIIINKNLKTYIKFGIILS